MSVDIVVTGEECSGDRRTFWADPGMKISCQESPDDLPEDQAHSRKFHCHHWYEDQGCCACTVQTVNLAVFSDHEVDDKTLEIAIRTMEAYLVFGDAMDWPGMTPGEQIHLKTRIKKGLEKLQTLQLER